MPVSKSELQGHYQGFLDDLDDDFRTTRIEKKKNISKLLSEDNVKTIDISYLYRTLEIGLSIENLKSALQSTEPAE